jgi:NAD(P)-dependent dehydrogenase (short-subunit alcohol dehydrogenase family)
MKLAGKVACITGGAQGIGAAIATRFAEEGARVAIADLNVNGELESGLKARGLKAVTVHMDVSSERSVDAAMAQIEQECGPLDILVNNAGIGTPVASILDTTPEDWERTMRVNLTGSLMCTRAALRSMIPRKTGNILNISSNVGKRGVPLRSAYTASKWGMLGLTQTAALEVAKYGIRVNALLPGNVDTPHLTEVVQMHADAEKMTFDEFSTMLRSLSPMNRYVELEEIGKVAVFLVSHDSSAMTGQLINVSAGWIMY